jgi:hypothetical protein
MSTLGHEANSALGPEQYFFLLTSIQRQEKENGLLFIGRQNRFEECSASGSHGGSPFLQERTPVYD